MKRKIFYNNKKSYKFSFKVARRSVKAGSTERAPGFLKDFKVHKSKNKFLKIRRAGKPKFLSSEMLFLFVKETLQIFWSGALWQILNGYYLTCCR